VTLSRAKRGDREAFRTLVATYQDRVFALLGRMLFASGRVWLVEDLAQETFARVFRALPREDGRTRLSTWILSIAARLALNELRRSSSGQELAW
jgi:RNA polymerase sigma-70 factor (ECF subfamily)